jgi:hypothetical protein
MLKGNKEVSILRSYPVEESDEEDETEVKEVKE